MMETDMTVKEERPVEVDGVLLSVDSQSELTARFHDRHGQLGIAVEVLPVTEAADVDLQELAQLDLLTAEMEDWAPAEIGRAISHWVCWHQAVETQRATCILQVDAVLRSDFLPRLRGLLAGLPPNWDILQLGFDTRLGIDFRIAPDCRFQGQFTRPHASEEDLEKFRAVTTALVPVRMFTALGSFAYVVSPAGAQKLIDGCFPLATKSFTVPALKGRIRTIAIDAVMNALYGEMEAYMSFPPLALSSEQGAPAIRRAPRS